MIIFPLDSVNAHLWNLLLLFGLGFILNDKSALQGLIPSGDYLSQFKLEGAEIVLQLKVVYFSSIIHVITSDFKIVCLLKVVIDLNWLNKLRVQIVFNNFGLSAMPFLAILLNEI